MRESDSGGSEEEGGSNISLGDFVDENASIFLVMGVFAALSVYISNLPKDGLDAEVVDAGVVSALIISGILSLILFWRILEQVGGIDGIIDNLFTLNNIDFLLFIIAYTYLLDSLIKIVIGRPRAVGAITTSLTIVALFLIAVVGVRIVRNKLEKHIKVDRLERHLNVDDDYVDILALSSVLFLIWFGCGTLLDRYEGDIQGVQELQNPTVWEAISNGALFILSTFRPVVGVALVYAIVLFLFRIASDVAAFFRDEEQDSIG